MKTNKFAGIVLSSKPFFESDKLIDCFTEQDGKIRYLAKSAQKPNSQFGSKCDPLSIIEGELYKGKSFNILTNVSLVQSFKNLRQCFNTLQLALFFLKIILYSTEYNQKNQELYNVLICHLNQLDKTKKIHSIKLNFYQNFLVTEGLLTKNATLLSEQNYIKMISEYTNKSITPPLYLPT